MTPIRIRHYPLTDPRTYTRPVQTDLPADAHGYPLPVEDEVDEDEEALSESSSLGLSVLEPG